MDDDTAVSALRRVGIIGGGTMGAGIAYAALRAGLEVTVVERDDTVRATLSERVGEDFARDLARETIDEATRDDALGRLVVTGKPDALPWGLDLVVEAVPEVLAVKHAVLADAERRSPSLLASNTSSIPIDRLAEGLAEPARFVGMHFFNPVRQMTLVEVVRGRESSSETVARAAAAARQLGKEPLVVEDAPGFLTSRLGVLLGLEAIRMLEGGLASAEDIDRAMVLGYGHPIGPLRLTDLVGLDVRLGIARVLEHELGPRFSPPPLLERLVEEGRLGKKSGRGFFEWPAG